MKKLTILILAAVFVVITAGLVSVRAEEAAKNPAYYVCNCGADCKCDSISSEPGKCSCGKDMVQMHLLSIEGDKAYLCTCGKDCDCKMDPNDKTKCGCGKPVKTVGLKGKYVCACGPDCTCGMISDKPGKCGCGKELKQVM
jgi:hypothetical protein